MVHREPGWMVEEPESPRGGGRAYFFFGAFFFLGASSSGLSWPPAQAQGGVVEAGGRVVRLRRHHGQSDIMVNQHGKQLITNIPENCWHPYLLLRGLLLLGGSLLLLRGGLIIRGVERSGGQGEDVSFKRRAKTFTPIARRPVRAHHTHLLLLRGLLLLRRLLLGCLVS